MKTLLTASLLAGFASSSYAAELNSALRLGGGTHFTHWSGYDNSWAEAQLQIHSSQPRSRLSYSGELLYRSDSTLPLLGNIGELLYRSSDQLAWGRLAPREEKSLMSLDRSLNHRICQTPLDCALGGTIGAHYISPRFRLSFELLSLPNFSPTPKLSSSGQLSSKYRWTEIPYQFVEVDGARLPLRVSSSVNIGAATFLSPGLVLEAPLHWNTSISTNFVVATQRSKSAYSKRVDGVLVIDDPKQGLLAVANSEQNVSFPWQNIALATTQLKLAEGSELELDLGSRMNQEKSYEAVFRARHQLGLFSFEAGAGQHLQDDYEFSSFSGEARFRSQIFHAQVFAQKIVSQDGSSLMLIPELKLLLGHKTRIFAKTLLIQAESGESLFSKMRANDSAILGAEYVF